MEYSRSELMPGVFLSHLRSDKFKTACMSINLLTQLRREAASMNALIPAVLRRGTTRYPDMEKLSARLDELYGAAIEPVIRRVGEVHCLGFFASFPEPAFLPKGERLLGEMSGLMAEMLLSPVTRGGLLLPQYVDSEKEKLLDLIRSRVNDKRSYAVQRCLEEMCCYEDFAVSRFGSIEEAEGIHYKKLTRHYRELLRTSPVELFYCGQAPLAEVEQALREAFAGMPRGEVDYDIGTEIRMNAVEAEPRYYEERMGVTQGKLVLGFRLGECMEDPDRAAIHVFNALYGSGATSKLFLNVRDVKNGDMTDEELLWAKRAVASDLRATMDSQGELEGYWLSQALDGLEYSPTELAELVGDVTKEDVMAVANSVVPDLVYFLRGEDGAASEEDEEAEDEA